MRKLNLKLVYIFRLFYRKRGEENKVNALVLLFLLLLSTSIFSLSILQLYFGETFLIKAVKSKVPLIVYAPFVTIIFLQLGKLFKWKGNFKETKDSIKGLKSKGRIFSILLVLLSLMMLVISVIILIKAS